MKKFMGWLMVLAVGVFVMGCSEGDKKPDAKKPDAKAPEKAPEKTEKDK